MFENMTGNQRISARVCAVRKLQSASSNQTITGLVLHYCCAKTITKLEVLNKQSNISNKFKISANESNVHNLDF